MVICVKKQFKLKKLHKYNLSDQLRYVVTYKVRKVAKSVKTSLLLSNVIDADHQNSCLFANKGHLSSSLCVVVGILAKFRE